MLLSIPSRAPFYVLLLILGLLQFIATLNIPSHEPYLPLFTTACALVALFTFIWVAFLLGHGSSEFENNSILTRCDIHILSFGLISFLWLCLGVFLIINAKNECDRHTLICQYLVYCTIIAFLMFLFALCSAAIVTYSVTVAGLHYASHVEYARGRALELVRAQGSMTFNVQRNGQDIPLPVLPPTKPPLAHASGPALPV